jgi:phosphoglucomutase
LRHGIALEDGVRSTYEWYYSMSAAEERCRRWLESPIRRRDRADLPRCAIRGDRRRFYRDLSFGTGGMRGVMGAGTNRLNRYNVRRVACGLADYLKNETKNASQGVVIAFDTRINSAAFARETADTLLALGVPASLYEAPVPTPMLSFSVPYRNAAAGVMITASHNPPAYNGIKIYDENGVQLTPPKAAALTARIERQPDALELPAPRRSVRAAVLGKAALDAYLDAVQKQAFPVPGKEELAIVYTPIHGAGLVPVTEILRRDGFLNVTLVYEQCEPDGAFPSVVSPNPEERGALAMGLALAEQTGADLVLGTDPDSDRLGVGVRHGGGYRLLSGNQIGALMVWFVLEKRKGSLKPTDTIVKTIVTGELGAKIAKSHGVKVVDTLTGFKYIGEASVAFERTNRNTFLMGYEESYGCLVGTHSRDKDAVVSAMLMAELAAEAKTRGQTLIDILDGLYARYGAYADALETVLLPGERGMREIAGAMARFRSAGTDAMPEPCALFDYQTASTACRRRTCCGSCSRTAPGWRCAERHRAEAQTLFLRLRENAKSGAGAAGQYPRRRARTDEFNSGGERMNIIRFQAGRASGSGR